MMLVILPRLGCRRVRCESRLLGSWGLLCRERDQVARGTGRLRGSYPTALLSIINVDLLFSPQTFYSRL